jgi:hypothetical protein
MESRSETLRPTDAVKKRQGDDFSVRADNLQIRPCDRLHPQTASLLTEGHHRATARHTTPLTDLPRPPVVCWPHAARSPARTGGGAPPARDHTGAHEPLPAGGTPLRMGVPPLRTHRLPVQRGWRLQRRLAQRRTTDGQGRRVAGMVQPIRPHHPRLRRFPPAECDRERSRARHRRPPGGRS